MSKVKESLWKRQNTIIHNRIVELSEKINRLSGEMIRSDNMREIKALTETRKICEERFKDNKSLFRKIYGKEA